MKFSVRPVSASFVFVEFEGKYLAVKRGATAPVRPNEWDLPGGKSDKGEQPLLAATRELYEESGIEAQPNFLTEYLHKQTLRSYYYYTATVANAKVSISPEHSDYEWVSLEELVSRLTHEPHAKAASLLQTKTPSGR